MIFFNSYVTAYSTDIASIHYPCFILDTNEIMVIHHEQVKGNISHQLAFILGSIPQLNTFLTLRKKLKKSRDQVTLKKYEHLKAVLTTQGLACNSDTNSGDLYGILLFFLFRRPSGKRCEQAPPFSNLPFCEDLM